MFGQSTITTKAAALTAAILFVGASSAPAAPPGYTGGYNPGYFSSQRGGYTPGYYGGRPNFGLYYPGYFAGQSSGYGAYTGGYYPGFYSSLHAESAYPSPYVTTPTPAYVPPWVASTGGRTMLPEMRALEAVDPAQADGGALVALHVPSDAEVWFDGEKTAQTGAEREFKSPALPVGRLYHYDVRARWTEGGKVVDQTRSIPAGANRRTEVDFTQPEPGGK